MSDEEWGEDDWGDVGGDDGNDGEDAEVSNNYYEAESIMKQ